jgi:hypothetical protein
MPAHKTKVVVVVVALAEKVLTPALQLRPLMLLNMPQFLATAALDWHSVSAVHRVGTPAAEVAHPDQDQAHCQTMQVAWAVQVAAAMAGKLQNWVK